MSEFQEMLNWTNDIPTGSANTFTRLLMGRPVKNLLEIGCYHGTSMVGFLTLFPHATATAVDIWDSDIKSELSGIDFNEIEAKFDKNTARFANRVEKVKGDSRKVLWKFIREGRKYDLIYVDGSHKAFDVYHDAILAWELLNPDGVIIFDDFLWMTGSPNVFEIPYHAILSFLEAYRGEYDVLQMDYRVFLKKLIPRSISH